MTDPEDMIRTSTYCSMVHVAQQLTREIAPDLQSLGIDPTLYLTLGQVLSHPGATPADLARHCHMTPQATGEVLRRAEERGLVNREGERGRGRRTHVQLTEAGRTLLEAGWPVVHGAGAERLSPAQHGQMQGLLDLLRGQPEDTEDVVVLVDDRGEELGTAPRLGVHDRNTPLHKAFSTHLRRPDGKVLITRRALHKTTWPGAWTNSACGHVRPGESPVEAALRRVTEELGVAPTGLRVVLPDFRYRAVDASGVVENELCPVMVGEVDPDAIRLDPAEVCEMDWVPWSELRRTAATLPRLLSPWSVLQFEALGEDPWQ